MNVSSNHGRFSARATRPLTNITVTKRVTFIAVPAISDPTRTNIDTAIIDKTDIGEKETITPIKMPKVKISLKRSGPIALKPTFPPDSPKGDDFPARPIIMRAQGKEP